MANITEITIENTVKESRQIKNNNFANMNEELSTAGEVDAIGTIFAFAGNDIPKGYLPCNGSAISRETYADLFEVIGTTYGAGDGSTTFNLPNLTDKFIQGSDTAGTVKSAGLPNITGKWGIDAGGGAYGTTPTG